MAESNREFKALGEVEHVLLRPNMYIGQTSPISREMWMLDTEANKFKFQIVEYVPALLKIFDEIIDNCLDVAIESNFKKISTISVKMDEKSFSCKDDGPGIPVKVLAEDKKHRTCVEMAWTQLRAGTSFSENRKGPSANGIGSVASNIFSLKFEGISDDGQNRQRIKCKKNMSSISPSEIEKSSGQSGVSVYLEPDLDRFSLTEISKVHQDLVYQRLINLSIMFPKLTFKFNGKSIKLNKKSFAGMFSENFVIASSENTFIAIFPNEYDEFKFFSYVNGLNTIRGGTHIDYISTKVCSLIRDKLVKKYKTIRPGDIKNKIGLVVFLTDMSNLQFDAQTKEAISNTEADIKKHIGDSIDFEKLSKEILKNESIIDPIIETFKLKEEVKNRVALKQASKSKVKIDVDKYLTATGGKNKYLMVTEGLSARGGLSSSFGRNGIAYYASRGVGINAYDANMKQILANQEFKDIMNILGLDVSNNKEQIIDFDKMVIATDSDADGIHITYLYLGWFAKFAPWMFDKGYIAKLNTPIAMVFNDKAMTKVHKMFFNLAEYKEFEKTHDMSKYTAQYFKGLGTHTKQSIDAMLSLSGGLDHLIQVFKLDDEGKIYIDDWLSSSKADKRKEHIKSYSLDINKI